MNLGFLYNVRHVKPDSKNPQYILEAEFDEPLTIAGVEKALRSLGHEVFKVEANENAYGELKKNKSRIDLMFNIAEGIYGNDREAQLPAMMEMLQIPYTGPKPLGYAVGLNKSVAKEIMAYYKIPTARWRTLTGIEDIRKKSLNFYPILLKPLSEGSSKGIYAKNLVDNFEDLKTVALESIAKFKQPVLAEEYLPGREFTVAVIGNPPQVLPIIELTFEGLPDNLPKFDHFEAKWIYEDKARAAPPFLCPAPLSSELEAQIAGSVLRAFDALEMADWARFDVRLDKNGVPNIIEVNCPPGIMPDPKENSRFPLAARVGGLTYPAMLEKILQSACSRYGIKYKKQN